MSSNASHGGAAELELRHVSKQYPGQAEPAIPDLSLTVPAGEICVLVGPSGSGKTTAMRLINRMIGLTTGEILLGGESVLAKDPTELRREIGYVIQQIGLFPHMSIADNIATVPRLLGWSKDRTSARVTELLGLIGLDAKTVGSRYPNQLSGGQQQRVGVARALAADPPLLLMDEPFGAIDPINRSRLQDEFLALQAQVRKTIVFVTHDIDEAIKMGDRIAILREGGMLAQYATPAEILEHPADDFVASFVGADRALKALGLSTLADITLLPTSNGSTPPATLDVHTSLRDALSAILADGGQPQGVRGADGDTVGVISLELLGKGQSVNASGGGPVIPTFGNHVSSCVKHNGTFCWSWFSANWSDTLWPALRQHIVLVVIAVGLGFIISSALALLAHRKNWVERPVLVGSAVLYTIPSIALFEILDSIKGLAISLTAVEIALVSYTIFILFRNMLTGLRGVPADVRDAAAGMGMTRNQVLWRVEIPMAMPAIIAGLRIATVTAISLGTIAAYVDNDRGLGGPIFLAIDNNLFKTELIAAGALAVLLALVADGLLVLLQRLVTPWARRVA